MEATLPPRGQPATPPRGHRAGWSFRRGCEKQNRVTIHHQPNGSERSPARGLDHCRGDERPQRWRTHPSNTSFIPRASQCMRDEVVGVSGRMDCRCCGQGHKRPSVTLPSCRGTLATLYHGPRSSVQLTPSRATTDLSEADPQGPAAFLTAQS